MSLATSMLIFLAGALISGMLFRLTRRRISEVLANGLAFMIVSLAFYPLLLWVTGSEEQSIARWIIASAIGGIATMSIYRFLRTR